MASATITTTTTTTTRRSNNDGITRKVARFCNCTSDDNSSSNNNNIIRRRTTTTTHSGISNTMAVDSSSCKQRHKCCTVCGKLPFHKPNLYSALCNYDDALFGFDAGIFELLFQMNEFENNENGTSDRYKVDDDVAKQTADSAEKHSKRLRAEMTEAGLLQRQDQNFSGECASARIVAPLNRDEIHLGAILGVGGFSSVLEVSSIQLDPANAAVVPDQFEELSRQFLAKNAVKTKEEKEHEQRQREKKTVRRKKKEHNSYYPPTRYALKHLRMNLVEDPHKFKRSLVDLVLEGQLLLALDHPNIIRLHGWPLLGTDAIRSGRISDYFLLLDQLPESLEERMWKWRQSLKKYKSRCVFPWFQSEKFGPKIEDLFRDRLQVVHDVASAVEYLHSKRIIHRDIKASNLGFDGKGVIKLFDFGLTRILPPPKKNEDGSPSMEEIDGFRMSRVGTKFYIAPEIRMKKPYHLSADVYSFGVLFWEILSLSTPRTVFHKTPKKRRATVAATAPNAAALKAKLEIKNRRSSAPIPLTIETKKQAHVDQDDEARIQEKQHVDDDSKLLGSGWLPICPCWPEDVQHLVVSCLSEEAKERPSISDVRSTLVFLGLNSDEKSDETPLPRRSTFRLDLSGFANLPEFQDQSVTSAEVSCESKMSETKLITVSPI